MSQKSEVSALLKHVAPNRRVPEIRIFSPKGLPSKQAGANPIGPCCSQPINGPAARKSVHLCGWPADTCCVSRAVSHSKACQQFTCGNRQAKHPAREACARIYTQETGKQPHKELSLRIICRCWPRDHNPGTLEIDSGNAGKLPLREELPLRKPARAPGKLGAAQQSKRLAFPRVGQKFCEFHIQTKLTGVSQSWPCEGVGCVEPCSRIMSSPASFLKDPKRDRPFGFPVKNQSCPQKLPQSLPGIFETLPRLLHQLPLLVGQLLLSYREPRSFVWLQNPQEQVQTNVAVGQNQWYHFGVVHHPF